jgi:hypothetical protein
MRHGPHRNARALAPLPERCQRGDDRVTVAKGSNTGPTSQSELGPPNPEGDRRTSHLGGAFRRPRAARRNEERAGATPCGAPDGAPARIRAEGRSCPPGHKRIANLISESSAIGVRFVFGERRLRCVITASVGLKWTRP